MNILTIFSGRKHNIEILKKYLKKALELKIIDEVHFWNNTRNVEDEQYLKSISNLKRTSSKGSGQYNLITPEIYNNSFDLHVKASNDIHIKITNNDNEYEIIYEIVLGGWNNEKSVIRENNDEIFHLNEKGIANDMEFVHFKVAVVNDILNIYKNDLLIMSRSVRSNFNIKQIYFKTGHNCVGNLSYTPSQNHNFYFMDTCEKNWKNYYQYYSDSQFVNDIILKCDDDIVFIDLLKLPQFIDFIKKNDYDLVFANTINNGVSAYFQQNKFGLIPTSLMTLEYPNGGLCGSLWQSGKKAEVLHQYFIENHEKFLDFEYNSETIPIESRFSINFFGYKGKNWHKIKDCYHDDEYNLTVDYVKNRNFKNILYCDFYVSHLSFFKQVETGIHTNELIKNYHKLHKSIIEKGRFG
jgi:hypothetical protein